MPEESVQRRAMMVQTTPELLIFFHIGKTGGQTFGEVLYRNFREGERFNANVGNTASALGLRKEEHIRQAFLSLSDLARQQIRFVSGHVPFGVHRMFERPAKYVTIVRSPIDRVVSSFYYIRNQPSLPIHTRIRGMTLDEYIDSRLGLDPFDYQTRVLSGCPELDGDWLGCAPPHAGDVGPEHLEAAKRNIDQHFIAVAPLSHFIELLLLMRRMYGWRLDQMLFSKVNVTKDRPILSELRLETVERVRANNRFDTALYEWAEKRFNDELGTAGIKFAAQCALFRRLNRSFERHGMTPTLRRILKTTDTVFS